MKKILLTQGKSTFIDDEDFELISKYRWFTFKNRTGFVTRFYAITTPKDIMGKNLTLLI